MIPQIAAAHFLERAYRIGEILEGGAADQEIEAPIGKRRLGSVALFEADVNAGAFGVVAGKFDKSFADVEAGHAEPAFGEFDGKEAGARCHLQNSASSWQQEIGRAHV